MYVCTSMHLTSKPVHYNDCVRLSDISTRSIQRPYNGEILVVLFLTVKPGDEARLSVLWSLCKAVTSLLQLLSSSSKWQNSPYIIIMYVHLIKATTTLLQPLILFWLEYHPKMFIQLQTRGYWLNWCIHIILYVHAHHVLLSASLAMMMQVMPASCARWLTWRQRSGGVWSTGIDEAS